MTTFCASTICICQIDIWQSDLVSDFFFLLFQGNNQACSKKEIQIRVTLIIKYLVQKLAADLMKIFRFSIVCDLIRKSEKSRHLLQKYLNQITNYSMNPISRTKFYCYDLWYQKLIVFFLFFSGKNFLKKLPVFYEFSVSSWWILNDAPTPATSSNIQQKLFIKIIPALVFKNSIFLNCKSSGICDS